MKSLVFLTALLVAPLAALHAAADPATASSTSPTPTAAKTSAMWWSIPPSDAATDSVKGEWPQ